MPARGRSLINLLDCNFIVKCNGSVCISSTMMFAYHIDSTNLTDGDYQLIPEPEGDISEDPRSIIGDLTEAPNPGSKTFSVDISDPSPTSEGKPRT
jgi:hypothetical protein